MKIINRSSVWGIYLAVLIFLAFPLASLAHAQENSDKNGQTTVDDVGIEPLQQASKPHKANVSRATREAIKREHDRDLLRRDTNSNVVSIISGPISGAYLHYVTDIASVVDDGDKIRVLPIVGRGSVENISDILYLKGVDMGMVRTDSLETLKQDKKFGDLSKELFYVAKLGDDEMHVIAGKDITDLHQLNGKKVNVGVSSTGSNFSSPQIFKRLNIEIQPTTFEQADALLKLNSGLIDAVVTVGGKPLAPLAAMDNTDHRFHFVGVPYDSSMQDLYLPASLTSKDYPNLIAAGQSVDTVSASTVLAVYNLPADGERYNRVAHFIDAFFSKFDQLANPPYHPKWKDVNLAASVPGWTRFKPAQDWLDKNAPQAVTPIGDGQKSAEFERFVSERTGGKKSLSPQQVVELYKQFQARSEPQ